MHIQVHFSSGATTSSMQETLSQASQEAAAAFAEHRGGAAAAVAEAVRMQLSAALRGQHPGIAEALGAQAGQVAGAFIVEQFAQAEQSSGSGSAEDQGSFVPPPETEVREGG
eukprot:CAMPEP_0180494854 /NCGR_PEP_ID=MMETSP1036_2-20121128/41459_1 /TAXON_ID=632150 /ORGANISM="Azadinium spinosum, Strain 3D9" /LENGTH=111 /DNA_ID=CAMNT_0022503319 /DNA_START=142 /DNA_END=474 /DNA_ORIENTATION=+